MNEEDRDMFQKDGADQQQVDGAKISNQFSDFDSEDENA